MSFLTRKSEYLLINNSYMYISIFIIFGYNVFCSLTDVMFFFFIYESSSLVKHLVNSFMGVPNHKKIKFYLQKQKYGLTTYFNESRPLQVEAKFKHPKICGQGINNKRF